MSAKIQLLTIDELEVAKLYRLVHHDGATGSVRNGKWWREAYSHADFHYIPADAIEFVKPDPDKALIEEWVDTLKGTIAGREWLNLAGVTLHSSTFAAIARSFLDFKRAKEGKR